MELQRTTFIVETLISKENWVLLEKNPVYTDH